MKSSITLASESDLQWKATNLALEIDGKFHYKYKKGIIRLSGGGSVNVKFSDISFSVGVNLGVDGSGKPTIKAGKCSCDSGPVKVKFRGGLAWIYNLFSGKVGKIIASQFQSKMCGIIQDLIDKNAQESLSTIKGNMFFMQILIQCQYLVVLSTTTGS
ncbi:LBP [Mytilus edulis]|uniref:LBP n=1 Tax=Mytilus edulis TaxID=6550 RepID=A0A8S3PTS0_MYTED|nr:LBP [Mytilus edulis]